MQSPVVCIYHRNCLDGMTAAWVVSKAFPMATFIDADYQENLPEIEKDAIVYVVDFSYTGEQLLQLCAQSSQVYVLDHHEKAIKALNAFFGLDGDRIPFEFSREMPKNLIMVLDEGRSGAGITWDFLFPNVSRPTIVDLVEDYDRWTFKYPITKAYTRALKGISMDLVAWAWASEQPSQKLVVRGESLLESDEQNIQWLLDNALRMIEWEGYQVPLINAPKYIASEVNNRLVDQYPFVISYYDGPEYRVYRFNSAKTSPINVSELISPLGGGGHRNSAGLKVKREHPLAKL